MYIFFALTPYSYFRGSVSQENSNMLSARTRAAQMPDQLALTTEAQRLQTPGCISGLLAKLSEERLLPKYDQIPNGQQLRSLPESRSPNKFHTLKVFFKPKSKPYSRLESRDTNLHELSNAAPESGALLETLGVRVV